MSKFVKEEDSKGRIHIIEGTEKSKSEFSVKRFICEINEQATKEETREVTDLVLDALNSIEKKSLPRFFIESKESFWYWSSRNGKDFIELTYWFNPFTFERKETKRAVYGHYGNHYSLPDWAKLITDHRKQLDLD